MFYLSGVELIHGFYQTKVEKPPSYITLEERGGMNNPIRLLIYNKLQMQEGSPLHTQ